GPEVLRDFARFHRERLLRAVAEARADAPTLTIDEFLLRPPPGQPAWIEVRNVSDRPISLGGIRVAPRVPGEAFVPAGERRLAPGGRAVVILEGEARERARADGGAIALVRGEAPSDDERARSRVLDVVWYGHQREGISYGRDADPPRGFAFRERPTPGAPNAARLRAE
ncbi:MAG: lamin tail domain-containing protein, partial [Planctomycetes bacterium]|nr:lamin tail domain-containing protein [Planctomycetota bacterium]